MANKLMLPSWSTVQDAMGAFPAHKRREIEVAQAQAIAYVWGFQDAEGPESHNTGYSIDFGLAYAMHAAWYESEQLCYRRSIQDAFTRFRQGLALED